MLYYQNARKALDEALQIIDPSSDPVQYDMASGLYNLTEAVEADMQNLKKRLNRIESALQKKGLL